MDVQWLHMFKAISNKSELNLNCQGKNSSHLIPFIIFFQMHGSYHLNIWHWCLNANVFIDQTFIYSSKSGRTCGILHSIKMVPIKTEKYSQHTEINLSLTCLFKIMLSFMVSLESHVSYQGNLPHIWFVPACLATYLCLVYRNGIQCQTWLLMYLPLSKMLQLCSCVFKLLLIFVSCFYLILIMLT